MARVLVLDVIGGKGLYESEVNVLDDFYRELKCDIFDVATRKIGDKYFDLYVDDIGLFVEKPIVSVLDTDLKPMLVGNVIFANHDSRGETTSLTDADIEIINSSVIGLMAIYGDEIKRWDVIAGAEY